MAKRTPTRRSSTRSNDAAKIEENMKVDDSPRRLLTRRSAMNRRTIEEDDSEEEISPPRKKDKKETNVKLKDKEMGLGESELEEKNELNVVNILAAKKPFKNPKFKPSKKFKTLKQVLSAEKTLPIPADYPTYSSLEAPPSILPQKKYCDITGLEGKYTDPKTSLRYHSAEVFGVVKNMTTGAVQDFLGARNAAVILK